MPVNHVMKYLKSVHTVSLFFWLFSETLNFYFKMEEDFLKKIFGSNYYIWLVLWLVWRPAESKNLEWPLICIHNTYANETWLFRTVGDMKFSYGSLFGGLVILISTIVISYCILTYLQATTSPRTGLFDRTACLAHVRRA